eukprot:scaffold52911_cov21-Prasinocladus_malaysianus.AAC.1
MHPRQAKVMVENFGFSQCFEVGQGRPLPRQGAMKVVVDYQAPVSASESKFQLKQSTHAGIRTSA